MAKDAKKSTAGRLNVPKVEEDWQSVMILQSEETPVGAFICNWDYTDKELSDLLFLSERPSAEHGNDMAGKEIDLKYWICTKIRIPDRQAGGECDVVRTVLISEDRKSLSTLSVGILKSIELFRLQAGTGEINPPIRMRVIGSKMSAGSDMLTLVPVELADRK